MVAKKYKVIQGQEVFDYLALDEKSAMFKESEFGALAVNRSSATHLGSVPPGTIVMLTPKSPVWAHLDNATKRDALTVRGPDQRPLPKSFGYDYFTKLLPTGDSIFASRSRSKHSIFRAQFSTDLSGLEAAKLMKVFDLGQASGRIVLDDAQSSSPVWHKNLTPSKLTRLVRQAGSGLQSFTVAFKGDSVLSWTAPDTDRSLLAPSVLQAVEAAYGANKAHVSFTAATFNSLSFGMVSGVFAAEAAARYEAEVQRFIMQEPPLEGPMLPLADVGRSLVP